jgi:UDP-2,4-diacetamido-2,4,6-trideoxy-beta-L-altropyranose hydrolase
MEKIIFRADGNSTIGLGHVFRVLALSGLLKEDFDCFLAIKQPNDFVRTQAAAAGMEILELDGFDYKSFLEGHLNEIPFDLRSCLDTNDIVVLDGYWFGTAYQRQIKEIGATIVFIDDVYNEYPYADVIINHALCATPSMYRNTQAKIFAGPKYSLMRKEFLEAAQNKQRRIKFDTAFVCFGGADTEELAFKVSSFLTKSSTPIETIHILNSSAYKGGIEKFQQLAIDTGKSITVHQNLNGPEVIKLMRSSDVAIVSSSNIAYECACTGLPMVAGYYVDHQFHFYEALRQQANIEGIGKWQNATPASLQITAENLMQKYDPGVDGFIDGDQQKRFVELFKSISVGKLISDS